MGAEMVFHADNDGSARYCAGPQAESGFYLKSQKALFFFGGKRQET